MNISIAITFLLTIFWAGVSIRSIDYLWFNGQKKLAIASLLFPPLSFLLAVVCNMPLFDRSNYLRYLLDGLIVALLLGLSPFIALGSFYFLLSLEIFVFRAALEESDADVKKQTGKENTQLNQ